MDQAKPLRGTIIRVPATQPGLIVADGRQLPFEVIGVWRSAVAPTLNQTVDVELDESGSITGIVVVSATGAASAVLRGAAGAAGEWVQGAGGEKARQAADWVKSRPLSARIPKVWLLAGGTLLLVLLLVKACSGGAPSDKQILAALQRLYGQTNTQLAGLGMGGMSALMPTIHDARAIGCRDEGGGSYECQVEINATQYPMTQPMKQTKTLRFVKGSDGWTVLDEPRSRR